MRIPLWPGGMPDQRKPPSDLPTGEWS
jgi:hypothetical protein